MGIIVRARNYINTTAQAAHLHSLMKYRFSANGYRSSLKGMRKAGYFILGLGYSVLDVLKPSDSLSSRPFQMDNPALQTASFSNQIIPREINVAQAGIHGSLGFNSSAMIMKGSETQDTEGRRLKLIDLCERLFTMIKANTWATNGEFNSADLDSWFSKAIDPGTVNPLLEEAVDYLIAQYKIEQIGDGKYRIADQALSIMEVARDNKRKIEGASTLHSLFRAAEECFGKIWESSNHYIYDRESGELRLAGRKKGGFEESPYQEWRIPQYLYEKAIDEYIRTGKTVLEIDLADELRKEEAAIDPSSVEKDYQIFFLDRGNPGKILVGIYAFADQATEKDSGDIKELRRKSIRGIWSASNRILREEGDKKIKGNLDLRYKPPISPNHDIGDVAGRLHQLILRPIGKQIAELTGSKAAKVIWNIEEKELSNRASFGEISDISGLEGFAAIDRRTETRIKPTEAEYDSQKELEFWNWVFSSGRGNNVGLEAKIGGPVTDAHRRDFESGIVGRLSTALDRGKVVVWEDAAGATSIVSLLLEQLKKKVDDGPRVLPDHVRERLHCVVRDFSEVAVGQTEAAIAEAGFDQMVSVQQGDMFKRSEQDGNTVDFIIACMAFYCTRERFREALREWARISKPVALGWFSMKHKDGDLKVTIKDTIKGIWRAIPLWQKILFPIALGKMIGFLIQRKRAGAFEYGRLLREGFKTGKYYAPTEEQLREDLGSVGFHDVTIRTSLANQFFLVEWGKKPEGGMS